MGVFSRKRYFYWLIKAYFKKWGKNFVLFFVLGIISGLFLFFTLRVTSSYILTKIPLRTKETVGMVGAFTQDQIPGNILEEVSSGLTEISKNGEAKPKIAKSWSIKDNGKTYIFRLKENIYFNDGDKLTSSKINYSFKDVKVQKNGEYEILFKLKDSYSPFLITVSKPILKDGYTGVGEYKIKSIKFNGSFIKSIILSSTKNSSKIKTYKFYPTDDDLKTAYALGEVSRIYKMPDEYFEKTNLSYFPNTKVEKKVDYEHLITLFYNTEDKVLSDKKLRNALSYAIPDTFAEGVRSLSPFYPTSWAYQEDVLRKQDLSHAQLLLKEDSASISANINLTIKTISKYTNTANKIQKEWEKIGIRSKVQVVERVPDSFQIYLSDFAMPRDPDQYILWHSSQKNNITNYKSLRIDKFLEDGRKTIELEKRKRIYSDFQKYLMDDSPASFLYFPYYYEISRT